MYPVTNWLKRTTLAHYTFLSANVNNTVVICTLSSVPSYQLAPKLMVVGIHWSFSEMRLYLLLLTVVVIVVTAAAAGGIINMYTKRLNQ